MVGQVGGEPKCRCAYFMPRSSESAVSKTSAPLAQDNGANSCTTNVHLSHCKRTYQEDLTMKVDESPFENEVSPAIFVYQRVSG